MVAGWWEHHQLSRGTRAERKALESGQPSCAVAAYEKVDELVQAGGTDVVELLADLNDAGPEDNEGQWVGAGPLEDLLNQHGDRVIDEVDRLARQSPSFRKMLESVWFSRGTLTAETERRLALWVKIV